MKKINIGIVGGAGYTAGELLRIALNHPNTNMRFVHSNSNAGNLLSSVHTDLLGETSLSFTNELIYSEIEALFLCLGHGEASKFLDANPVPDNIKIIDLSQDFRADRQNWAYGLPELYKKEIQQANKIANPGCFATCLQLALLPLAANHLLNHDIHISATTGSTGAGQRPSEHSHFSWRSNNLSIYKPFEHQHLKEIKQSLTHLQNDLPSEIFFIPYRGSFTRGILAAVYTPCTLTLEEATNLYRNYYKDAPFVFFADKSPDVKQVANTNKCVLYIEKYKNQLLITSLIDNLTKGASGQAVQNFNLMFQLPETTGLRLKSVAF